MNHLLLRSTAFVRDSRRMLHKRPELAQQLLQTLRLLEADPEPGKHSRNWSLMNRINQKGARPQDQPIPLAGLAEEEQALIRSHYPELIKSQ